MHIIDTAGLREPGDVIEQMGIARTRDALQKADAILILLDVSRGMGIDDQKILAELPPGVPRLHIHNKIDLLALPARMEQQGGERHLYLSAKTGEGLDLLRENLLALIGWHQESGVFMARERHVHALFAARDHLQRAAGVGRQAEFFAEELRLAQEALNSITGEFTADDLLGKIFSSFCIGK